MNWLDVVLAIIIGLSLLAGLKKGLAREVMALAALILGLLCGLWFYGVAGSLVRPFVSSDKLANGIGFFIVFGMILLLGALVGRLVEKIMKLIHLSWLNRLLGGAFGLLRGVLISTVIILILMAFAPKPPPRSVVESRLAPYVVDVARLMAAAAPHELKEGFWKSYEKVMEIWADTIEKGLRKLPSREL